MAQHLEIVLAGVRYSLVIRFALHARGPGFNSRRRPRQTGGQLLQTLQLRVSARALSETPMMKLLLHVSLQQKSCRGDFANSDFEIAVVFSILPNIHTPL